MGPESLIGVNWPTNTLCPWRALPLSHGAVVGAFPWGCANALKDV